MFITKAFALALPLMVVANPLVCGHAHLHELLCLILRSAFQVARTDPPKSCNTGDLQCCESTSEVCVFSQSET